jgi:phosphatidylserine/phosphatidylglycerophosphate/cardiolipin synthase-like enzyme
VKHVRGALFLAASMSVAATATAFDLAPPTPMTATGSVEVAFAPWDDAQATLLRALDGAKREIYVQSFLFTSRALAFSLQQAKQRGVHVEVLADAGMNRRSDNGSQIPLLASSGIQVAIETAYASAHNKVILIDPQSDHCAVVTGSYNFTWSARNRNAENLLILRGNRQLAAAYLDNWKRHRAHATPYDQFQKQQP